MRRVLMLLSVTAPLVLPQSAQAQDDDAARLRDLMQAAAGRMIPEPTPATDPNLVALTAHLTRIAEARDADALAALADPKIKLSFGGDYGRASFRALMTEDWFWPAFRTVIEGGMVAEEWPEGRGVVFPAAFAMWPGDLDAYDYVYGTRPGAVLRDAPTATAPGISGDIEGRILVDGPFLPEFPTLHDDGWRHVCLAGAGCGFVAADEVRSPLDWRAIFVQSAPGAPWVLRTFIAGD